MPSNAELGARLLRNAAEFFRSVATGTPQIQEQMETNARTYETVAGWIESDPTGEAPVMEGAESADSDSKGE